MKLVFEYHWAVPYESQGVITVACERKSKIALQCEMLDEVKLAKCEDRCAKILGIETYEFDDLENQIEHNVYSLDDWFNKTKVK